MQFFEKFIGKVNVAMMWVTGLTIVFMGLLSTADIIMRSAFHHPIKIAFDLGCFLSASVAFLAGGYAQLTDRHVRVDIIYNRFSPRVKGILNICLSSLFFLLCIVMVRMGGSTALESIASGARTGDAVNLPSFIPQLLVPVGGLLLGLQGIVTLKNDIKMAISGKEEGK